MRRRGPSPAVPGETLMRRLPVVIEDITQDHDGPDDRTGVTTSAWR